MEVKEWEQRLTVERLICYSIYISKVKTLSVLLFCNLDLCSEDFFDKGGQFKTLVRLRIKIRIRV